MLEFLLISSQKRNKRATALQQSTSIQASDKKKYEACMLIDYMSSGESVSEVEEAEDRNADPASSGSEIERPKRKF